MVDHLFRTEYGKLVATLTRIFGASYIQLAEDIVQETLITALNNWGVNGLPQNPSGWLMQVAKRKVFNEIKRNKMKATHHEAHQYLQDAHADIDQIFLENEIVDSQLRMIFTCCHPSLSVESQIALTLKTLCGFGVREVANALLSTESTINKRLYRAKLSIRTSNLAFNVPAAAELTARLDAVALSLYLLYNEGYNSTLDDNLIQKDLCLEALRLCKLMADHFDQYPKLYALLSLMCFHTARFDARLDVHGAIVLFEDQDRSQWNKELINKGVQYLQKSMGTEQLSTYHIEAQIAAEHCLAPNFEQTDWTSIYKLYELLAKLKPNPIIALNLAIIKSKTEGLESSLKALEALQLDKGLDNYHLLPATQGVFLMKLEQYQQALPFLEQALKQKPSSAEGFVLKTKIEFCKEKLRDQ